LEFENALARLIANNLDVNVWIFKIDDEFGGRGHASLNVESIRTVLELRKKKIQMTESMILRLREVLNKILPKKVKLAIPTLYSGWTEYLQKFCSCGGVIEAAPPLCQISQLNSPSVSFLIEPDGSIQLLGSFDRFAGSQFVNAGCYFPQTSLPSIDLTKISNSVGEVLYENGVIGHITIDLVSFPNVDDPSAHPFFWAVDLKNELTDNAAIYYFFDILMEGRLDQQTGEYSVSWIPDKNDLEEQEEEKKVTLESRTFMFCNYLHHPGLANIQYKTFFHMCRLESISFDMESRSGSTFCLYDCLASGVIGMLTIGVHRKQTTKFMMDALNFVQNQVSVYF
jgi:IQ domain-containing protein H